MTPRAPLRLAIRIGSAAAAALALAPTAALAVWPFGDSKPAEPTHEIKAPHYGDAVYYFFQDRYFTSITTLMASQQLEEERGLLLAQLLMLRSDYAGAAGALSGLPTKGTGARYVRYNLGIALLKSGESKRGTQLLDDIGKESAPNEEYRSVRDRANLALGFSALSESRPKEARVYLERVRLQSLQTSKALLGFGWAADALGDPQSALVPWQELSHRDFGETAVLEAQIAIPYAYAKLGAYGQALQRYEAAIAAYERESAELNVSIKAIRDGKMIDTMVEQNPGDEMGWFWKIRDIAEMPRARHLAQVLAQHEFQEALKNYRDLRFLARNLEEWREKLTVFEDMLATRRKAFADRLPLVRERQQQIDVEALVKRREALVGEVAAGEAAGDGVAFADAKQIDLLERMKEVRRIVDAPNADEEAFKQRDRVRLVAGVLAWQISQDSVGRRWDAKIELERMESRLGEAKRHADALSTAQREEPLRFDRFARRIAAINPQLQVLIPRVAGLSREQRTEAQDIAVAELSGQQQRIAAYTMQARFALAQLYDRAYGKQDADQAAAAKP